MSLSSSCEICHPTRRMLVKPDLNSFLSVCLSIKLLSDKSIHCNSGKPNLRGSSASLSSCSHLCNFKSNNSVHHFDITLSATPSINVPEKSNSVVTVRRYCIGMWKKSLPISEKSADFPSSQSFTVSNDLSRSAGSLLSAGFLAATQNKEAAFPCRS